MKKENSIQTYQEDMDGILKGAISALGGRNGITKLAILSYIKAENPMLSYPNRHNLVFYLRRAINNALDNNVLQEANGKYKLVPEKKTRKKVNKCRDVPERSRPVDRVNHRRSRQRSTSLTLVDVDFYAFNKEPEDKRHKRHGRKRHGRRKGRRGSRRRRRRHHSYEAVESVSNTENDVTSKKTQSNTSEKEQISSNAGSDNSSSMDDSNVSGSDDSLQSALPLS